MIEIRLIIKHHDGGACSLEMDSKSAGLTTPDERGAATFFLQANKHLIEVFGRIVGRCDILSGDITEDMKVAALERWRRRHS